MTILDATLLSVDEFWKTTCEDMLILAYVPEADILSRAEALELALQRDLEAATALAESVQG